MSDRSKKNGKRGGADAAPVQVPARCHPHLVAAGLSRQVGLALRNAQAAVWGDLVATLEPFGLRPQQYAALLIADAAAGCKQQEVGEALGIFRSNLVALIETLVAAGLLVRLVKPDDRRSYALHTTRKGKALLARAGDAHAAHRRRIAAALGPHGEAETLALLDRLAGLGGKGGD